LLCSCQKSKTIPSTVAGAGISPFHRGLARFKGTFTLALLWPHGLGIRSSIRDNEGVFVPIICSGRATRRD
jgi:hypothetical protein